MDTYKYHVCGSAHSGWWGASGVQVSVRANKHNSHLQVDPLDPGLTQPSGLTRMPRVNPSGWVNPPLAG